MSYAGSPTKSEVDIEAVALEAHDVGTRSRAKSAPSGCCSYESVRTEVEASFPVHHAFSCPQLDTVKEVLCVKYDETAVSIPCWADEEVSEPECTRSHCGAGQDDCQIPLPQDYVEGEDLTWYYASARLDILYASAGQVAPDAAPTRRSGRKRTKKK